MKAWLRAPTAPAALSCLILAKKPLPQDAPLPAGLRVTEAEKAAVKKAEEEAEAAALAEKEAALKEAEEQAKAEAAAKAEEKASEEATENIKDPKEGEE